MKILVISDIHANIECLRAIWEQEHDAGLVVCAGDLVDYGTDPCPVIDWIREHADIAVRGNHDMRLVGVWDSGAWRTRPEGAVRWVDFCCGLLDEERVGYLRSLPETAAFEADGYFYLMTHIAAEDYGILATRHAFDTFRDLHAPAAMACAPRQRMIFGHTHRQMAVSLGGEREWLNPGSASYRRPDDPEKEACYAVIEEGVISLRRVPYNREPIAEKVRAARKILDPGEYGVAEFFFIKTEADGPDA